MVVVLQETQLAHWYTKGVFNKSIPDSPPASRIREDDLFTDIEHVLRPFWIAGTTQHAEVRLPAAATASKAILHEAHVVEALFRCLDGGE